ncbi:MAG: YcxB family protein [Planctomycetes bacterium]|nr:YcxB family protein [Planctomycetota bacterium]
MSEASAASPLRVKYQNTLDDWVALQKSVALEQRIWVRLGPILTLEAMIIGCCLPGTLLLAAVGEFNALLWGVGLIVIFNVLVFLAIRWPGAPDPKIFRPTTLEIHPDYLEIFNDRGWERRDWRAIARVQAAPELLIMYRDDGLMYVVPRRAFAASAAADEFAAAAQRFHEQAKERPRDDRPAAWQESSGPPVVEAADTMQVRYTASARELVELQGGAVLHTVEEPPKKQPASAGLFSWLLLAGVMVMMFLMMKAGGSPFSSSFAAFFVFHAVSVLMIFPLLRLLRLFAGRRMKDSPSLTHTLTISPAGVALWAPGVETRSAWETVDAVQQNRQLIAFTANRPALIYLYVIPKSAFADAEAGQRFAQMAARYRKAAAERVEEQELSAAPVVESGNPYQPPQSR